MRAHHISFKHALDGLVTAIRTQPNFRIHISFSLLALAFGLVLKISRWEWIIIVLAISIGMALELINTAIEFAVDLITDQHHILAKYAKDIAASAMLVFSVGAVIIAAMIFLPKLWPFI